MILLAICVACTTSVNLTGNYVNLQWYQRGPILHTLQVGGVVVTEPNDYTVGISTLTGYPNMTVHCLYMDFNNMQYLPGNYTRFFTSITFLIVRNSHVKYVTKADFSGLKNIIHVDFQDNEIEHLPENLFQGVSMNLVTVSFINNRITNIGPRFIANIQGLKTLFLSLNTCINLNSPVIFKTFTTTITTKCQLPIISKVRADPLTTIEKFSTSNTTTVDLINENKNLTTEIMLLEKTNNNLKKDIEDKNKLSTDLNNCKLSSVRLRNELTIAYKNKSTIGNRTKANNG